MSASVPLSNQLKLFWDHFFHSETGTYEKSTWLDLFLAEYLLQLKDGCDPISLVSFCPTGGIVTLVGCELLCGVHCVTSSSCSQFVHLTNDFSRDCPKSTLITSNSKNTSHPINVPPILPLAAEQNYSNIQNNASCITALKKYLLKGSAWRCLALLQSLGVEGLSCSRQLTGVLVWLYGELSGAGGVCHAPNRYLPHPPDKPLLYDLFSNKIWIKKNSTNILLLRNNGSTNNVYGTKHFRSRKKSSGKKKPKENLPQHNGKKFLSNKKCTVNNNNKGSDSSNSEQNSQELGLLNRSFTLKAKLNTNDFDYFSAVVRSEEDASNDALYSPIRKSHYKKKPVIEDYMSERHRAVLNSEISQYEFSEMAINLLYQLCKSEINTNDSEALHISVQCINFALKYLCTLQFESSPASHVNLTSCEATRLKTSLTELLILSFDKVLMHSDLFNKIISNGILPMLLHLLEDATYKLQVRLEKQTAEDSVTTTQASQQTIDELEASNWAKYLFGISYSILVFFYCMLMQNSSLGKIHDFVEQFKLFGDCRRGFILRDTINLMLRIPGVNKQAVCKYIKKILILINKLITTLKLVRSELVHCASCPRNKHKTCRAKVFMLMQHHHDVLGSSFCHTGNMSLSPTCSVSTLYATLASLLSDDEFIQSTPLRSKLLKCMRNSGSCCCFSPQFLLDKVVKIIRTHNTLANLCFLILEQTLYGELGVMYNSNVETFSCSVCDNYFFPDQREATSTDVFFRSTNITSTEGHLPRNILKHSLSENDNMLNVSEWTEYKVMWPFLSKYIPLLQGDNMPMLHSTLNHLLKMSLQCKHFVKHDLLFCVLYPAFVMAKSRYLLTNNDSSYFVTNSCLRAFANLLGFPIFAKEFIQKGGLNDILDLIALPEFSKQCCSILEIATVTEIFITKSEMERSFGTKPGNKSKNMTSIDVDKLPSMQILVKSLYNITRKAFDYFKLKVDKNVYDNIMNSTKDQIISVWNKTESSELNSNQGVSSSKSMPSVLQIRSVNISEPYKSQTVTMRGMQHSSIEQIMSHHMEVLKSVWIFWKTCCALCLYSPLLREYFVNKKIFQDSFKILQLVLHCIITTPCSLTEHKTLMKISEVIVTIHVSVSDYTMEKSKLVTTELLQRILISNAASNLLDLNNVKLLCDMLIRVASTQPSNIQVMPPKNKIKLPWLRVPGNSEDEHSSSGEEDSGSVNCQRKPYMSEGSDTYHSADEGYEADVEVGVVDSLSADAEFDYIFINPNSKNIIKNPVHSIINNIGLATDIDYLEYKKLDVVTYPELCYIVLRVVLNLIDRILVKEETLQDTSDISSIINVVCSCLSKMSTLFFHDVSGSSVAGFISQILQSPSSRLLKRRAKHLEELQNSLLKLFFTLASKSITPNELKLYLSLLNDYEVPLNILLEPLQRLADTVHPNVPDFIVCFPVDAVSTAVATRTNQQAAALPTNSDLNSTHIEGIALCLHYEHGKHGIRSCWSKMGMWCPIEGVSWGLWLEGCSITMWMMLRDTQSHSRTQSKASFYSTSDDSFEEGPSDLQSSHLTGSLSSQRSRRNVWHSSEDPLNTQSNSETDILNILHLVSIGHDSVMIEFWVNVVNGDILIQLTKPASKCNNIIGEGVLKNCVNVRCWNHLTLNIKEISHKKTLCIEVQAFVNGSESKTLIPLTGELPHRVRPAFLVIGHSTPSDLSPSSRPRGSWFLSNLCVFRTPILTKYTAMYLMAHGPDIKPMTSCLVGNQVPNFGPLFTPNVVGSNIDWDQVLDISSTSIAQMQDKLLLLYSARSPNNVDIYHQTIPQQNSIKTVFRMASQSKTGKMSMPTPSNVHWMGHCLSSQHNGFSPSLYLIGGPNVLLYLYARPCFLQVGWKMDQLYAINVQVGLSALLYFTVSKKFQVVELECNGEVQANALNTLFKVSLSDSRLHSMFQQDEILNMLHVVFASQKCKMDQFLLKVLIDASCDKSILVKSNNVFHLLTKVNVIIKYPEILVAAMKAWRQLENASENHKSKGKSSKVKNTRSNRLEDIDEELLQEGFESKDQDEEEDMNVEFITEENGLLGVLFQCINIMLRDENPFRQFNIYQLNRFNMAETLLMMCKERFLHSNFGKFNEVVSYGLVELIRSLMGCPPCMHHVAMIADFLILMHEYSSTYIIHSRLSIYFLLTELTIQQKEKRGFEIFGFPIIQSVALGEVERPSPAKKPRRILRESDSSAVQQPSSSGMNSPSTSGTAREDSEITSPSTVATVGPDFDMNPPFASADVNSPTSDVAAEADSDMNLPPTSAADKIDSEMTSPSTSTVARVDSETNSPSTRAEIGADSEMPSPSTKADIRADSEMPSTSTKADVEADSEMTSPTTSTPTRVKFDPNLPSTSDFAKIDLPSISTVAKLDSNSFDSSKEVPCPPATSLPLTTTPSKCTRNMVELNTPKATKSVADSPSTEDNLDFIKEYDVVGSKDVKPEEKSPVMLYQKLRSPVLLRNLRTCATRSWTVCEGILLLLRDTITIMPDTCLPQILAIILGNEMLLVLANHSETSVRSAVVKVVGAILQRSSAEEVKRFHDRNYFYNLANQISQKDASYELVSACTSLITGRRATIEDQLEDDAWLEVKDNHLGFAPPLMAVLASTLHDISLTHNTTLVFRKIISLASIKALVSIGMPEAIMKCLKRIGNVEDPFFEGRELLLNDMRGLLNVILKKILLTDKNSQLYADIYNMLTFLDMMERKRSKRRIGKSHVFTVMRDTQCFLIREELNYYQEMLTWATNESLGISPNVPAISEVSDQEASESASHSAPSSSALSRSAPTTTTRHRMRIPSSTVKVVLPSPEDLKSEFSRDELRNRVIALLKRAVAFFTNREWSLKISPYEIKTVEIIFLLLVSISSGGNRHFHIKWWRKFMGNNCHFMMSELFTWMISPMQENCLRVFALQTVFESWPNIKKILTPTEPRKQRQKAAFLIALLSELPDSPEDVEHEDHSLKQYIKSWSSAMDPQIVNPSALEGEIVDIVSKDNEKRKAVIMETFDLTLKTIFGKEALIDSVIASAMMGTQSVGNVKSEELKLYSNKLKKNDSIFIASCHKWQKLLDTFGHERGVWYDEQTYPHSWELDPTEGPSRTRVRLKRCHIDVDKKFMKEKYKYKVDLARKTQPLSYLFTSCLQSDYLDRLHMTEVISLMKPALYVTVKSEMQGEVILSDRCVHFLPDDKTDFTYVSGIYLFLNDITSVQRRRWRLSEKAVEIMLSSGHAHFLAFEEDKDLDEFLTKLDTYCMPLRKDTETLSACAALWRNGEITNWEYLMHLNILAGRTYNDLMQYPVLPFILADYTSSKLDLGRTESYRNFKKPIAVQESRFENAYIQNYNNLREKYEERRRDNPTNTGGFTDEPFHYGSHYSNSATVLHFLVRLPPYTKQFTLFQDGSFDMPDRTFYSMEIAWKLAGGASQSSCKELTPEFFYQPRIFTNDEGFSFGFRQIGLEVNDVELPNWCTNARIFSLILRQALESPHVRENIPHWIDLIFGYKQTGQAAIDTINVFHPSTYFGYKPTLSDIIQRNALDAMIRTYGQTPRQLLKLPHPQCITNLKHVPESVVEVLPTVSGLRWGYYCASPQQGTPWMVWTKKHKPITEKLIALTTGEVIGLPSHATLIAVYSHSSTLLHNAANTSIAAMAVITWGHTDGIIRIKQKKDVPPEPLFQVQDLDQVCVVSHGCGSTIGGLWIGLLSGRIVVLQPSPIQSGPITISFSRKPNYLFGHNSAITSITISATFGVAVSTCKEGLINVWDLHDLTLVRALSTCELPLKLLCLSETLCDVCTIYDIPEKKNKGSPKVKGLVEKKVGSPTAIDPNAPGTSASAQEVIGPNTFTATRHKVKDEKLSYKSKIRIQTINGSFIGETNIPERVTTVCYSNAPEGVSVNCVIVGLESGNVRLFSSWDLTPMDMLISLSLSGPMISICYSYDAHFLYMAGHDGTIMVWASDNIKGMTAGFRTLNNLPIF